MAGMPSSARQALAWLEQQVIAGHGGKVLLAGFDGKGPVAAWAAGLRGEQDYPNFTAFARFALQKLAECDAYWLLLPMEFDDGLGYHVQLNGQASGWFGDARWREGRHWTLQETASKPLLQDLLAPGGALPGLMRRDLTRLAGQLAIDPPETGSVAGQ